MSNIITFLIRVSLTALVFFYVFPHFGGVHYHGGLWPDAFIAALVFAVTAVVVNWVLALGMLVFTAGTLGLGLFVLVPAMILGFWLIPVVQLNAMAQVFPSILTLDNWTSAIIPGLILLLINGTGITVSSEDSSKK